MPHEFTSTLDKLPPKKGAYHYFEIPADLVNELGGKRGIRVVVNINHKHTINVGFNSLGNGNYFIIVGKEHLKKVGLDVGDTAKLQIEKDPNPLGVAVPEVIEAILEQDTLANKQWESLTNGKKRSIIFATRKIKNIDLQIERVNKLLEEAALKAKMK